jgi:hypothetical protein
MPLQLRRPVGIGLYRVYRVLRNALRELLGRLPFLATRDFVYDERFYAKGDPELLDAIGDVPEARYLHENLMVFERSPELSS